MHNLDARRAGRLVIAQLITFLGIGLLASPFGLDIARDVLIGGFAAWLGSAIFAVWVFGRYRAQEPGRIVARFYGGEVIKISMVVVVFTVAIKLIEDINPIAVFGAFLVVQVLPPLLANRIVG